MRGTNISFEPKTEIVVIRRLKMSSKESSPKNSGGLGIATMFVSLAAIMFVGVFGLDGVLFAQDGHDDGAHNHVCTLASLDGTYGFTGTGTSIGEGPVASVGIFIFDGKGTLFADFTQSRNGVINYQSPSGVYTVTPNCRGSFTISNGSTVDFVLVGGGREIMWIRTNPGVVITAVAKKQTRPDKDD